MSEEIFHLLHQWEEPALWECLIKWDEQHRAQLEYAHGIHLQYKSERAESFSIADKYAELINTKFGELLAVREAVERIAPDLAGPLDVRGPAEIGSPVDRAHAVRDLVRKLQARLHASLVNTVPPAGAQQGEGEKPGAGTDADRSRRDPNKPSRDRQDDILATIRDAGMPLTRPELINAMKLKSEGKLGANLAWMVANGILINIPQRGYWPADDPVPE
jgi:hypothetical protein